MGQILFTSALLEEQRHKVCRNFTYQDNKSAIMLAENGRDPPVNELDIWISDTSL